MLKAILDKENATLLLEPQGALTQEDFENVAKSVDPYIEEVGTLRGVIIYAETFPGWDSFGALVSHIKFVRNHHEKIAKVALVTDFTGANLAKNIAQHFVHAQMKHFPFAKIDEAKTWIAQV